MAAAEPPSTASQSASLFDSLLEPGWRAALADQFDRPEMQQLQRFLIKQRGHLPVYPQADEVFSALNLTSLEQVKVVILGQDPYHGESQAHGLSFSVKPGIKVPPSLANIYKELHKDLGCLPVEHGYLCDWAEQGVLLLNAVLTVEQAKAGSHQGKGWESFTDRIIEILDQQHEGIVFMLWGSHAQKKGKAINNQRHCVLQAPHPSPLSAYRGFLGCGHFSAANRYLVEHHRTPIDWQLPGLDSLTIDPSLRTPTTGQLF